jgi:GntR family transcriptional regulator, transcriptional repressor for pyruvate dehydrogenase complex
MDEVNNRSAVDRRSLPEQVATRLHEQIAGGIYPGGSRLPHQRDLAASFGVSTAVAREALALLAAGGLIRSRSGQGTFVTDQPDASLRFPIWVREPTGPAEVAETIEARIVLERAIAGFAAQRHTSEDIERLREILDDMRAAGDDADAFTETDLALHLALAAAARNRVLAGALAALRRMLRETIMVGVRSAIETDWMPALVQSHVRLVDAVEARDGSAARAAMDAMLERLRDEASTLGLIVPRPADAA